LIQKLEDCVPIVHRYAKMMKANFDIMSHFKILTVDFSNMSPFREDSKIPAIDVEIVTLVEKSF